MLKLLKHYRFIMNKLTTARRAAVVAALVEGNSIRATARMTNVSKPTILRLLAEIGPVCARYMDTTIRNIHARRVQVDEIWQFVYAKAKNVPVDKRETFGYGDVWTRVAIDADTKLVLSHRIGPRDSQTAYDLMHDLADRITQRVQLTTDGFRRYPEAVEARSGKMSTTRRCRRCTDLSLVPKARNATARRGS